MSCFVTRLHIQALTVIGIINIGNEACLHLTFGFTASSKAINILRAQPHASGILPVKFITVTSSWARWRFKSTASQLFSQSFIQAQIKESIKAPLHWSYCMEFSGCRKQKKMQVKCMLLRKIQYVKAS